MLCAIGRSRNDCFTISLLYGKCDRSLLAIPSQNLVLHVRRVFIVREKNAVVVRVCKRDKSDCIDSIVLQQCSYDSDNSFSVPISRPSSDNMTQRAWVAKNVVTFHRGRLPLPVRAALRVAVPKCGPLPDAQRRSPASKKVGQGEL